jgi:RNA polymerase-binding transcription factor DksA
MKAVRKDYFLDHDHSAYVDQWDWERVITKDERNLDFLKDVVNKLWKVIRGAGKMAQERFPRLKTDKYPDFPEELTFLHAEEMLNWYPDLPRKEREIRTLMEKAEAIFIIGIGWPLKDGYPHEMRAADYDDWATETIVKNGERYHGLNGDILVWNPVTRRRHELTSMGIRVTKETLKIQLKMSGQEEFLNFPYHRAILNDEIPLSIGGGIGESRTHMYLLNGPSRRSRSLCMAEDPQGYVRKEKHPCLGVREKTTELKGHDRGVLDAFTITMTKEEKAKLKNHIKDKIGKLEKDIVSYEQLTRPIPPDNAIGRLTRMEAISSKSINEAALRRAKQTLTRLERVLKMADTPDFGLCSTCEEPIPFGRLMIVPETGLCVECAESVS